MRSEISSFKGLFSPTLLKKDIWRFWPLWAGYGAVLFFALPMTMFQEFQNLSRPGVTGAGYLHTIGLNGAVRAAATAGLFYGLLCAMALFSYLMDSKACQMLHALPIRREGLFFTHWTAGLLFILVPNLVIALLCLAMGGWIRAAQVPGLMLAETFTADVAEWLAVETVIPMFFYCFALCCAMFTGSLLALPVFYGILNILVWGINLLVAGGLFPMLLAGYESGVSNWVKWFTPADFLGDLLRGGGEERLVAVCYSLVAGAVFTVIALAVYRLRRLERAGDLVTVGWVRPVFQYGFAVCIGLTFGLFVWDRFFPNSGTDVLIGLVTAFAVLGAFAGRMLLKKTFRVFADGWKGVAVMAAVLTLLMVGVKADFFGYQRWTPDPDEVEYVHVSGVHSMPYDSGSNLKVGTDDPESIRQAVDIHKALVSDLSRVAPGNNGYSWGQSCSVAIGYTMKNGELVVRRYSDVGLSADELDTPGTYTNLIQEYINTPWAIRQAYFGGLEPEDCEAVSAWLSGTMMARPGAAEGDYEVSLEPSVYPASKDSGIHSFTAQEARMLWEAVKEDLAAGRIGRRYLLDTDERYANCYQTDIEFALVSTEVDEKGSHQTNSMALSITPQITSVSTLKALEELGCADWLAAW